MSIEKKNIYIAGKHLYFFKSLVSIEINKDNVQFWTRALLCLLQAIQNRKEEKPQVILTTNKNEAVFIQRWSGYLNGNGPLNLVCPWI